jgi:hypothetical protein
LAPLFRFWSASTIARPTDCRNRGVISAPFVPAIRIFPAVCVAVNRLAGVLDPDAAKILTIKFQKQPLNSMPKLCASLMSAPGPPLDGNVCGS